MISFGEWSPDVADLGTVTLDVARNVVPGVNSWKPVMSLLALSTNALSSSPCRGLWYVQRTDGGYDTYAGTSTKLYKYNADTLELEDVSRTVGGDYSVPSDDFWSAVQFGKYLIAVNLNDDPQVIDIDTGTVFAALVGSPPAGRFVTVMDDRVVISHLASNPRMIAWSDVNDMEEWSGGLADMQEFPDHGAVMGTFPHARMIMLERGLRAIVPTNDTLSFQFPELTSQKGTVSPYGVIELGSMLYWPSEDGFYAGNVNGQKCISENRTSGYFFDQLNRDRMFQISGTFDPYASRVYWAYPTGDTEYNDRIIGYDWTLDRWFEWEMDTYVLARLATAAVTLEGGTDSTDLDLAGLPSFDSRIYMAGVPLLVAITTDLKLSLLGGPNLEATLETGTYQFGGGARARLKSVLPFIEGTDGEDATLQVAKRQRLSDDWTWSGEIPQQTSGRYPCNHDGFFHRLRLKIPAGSDWTHAQGWEPDFARTSLR